MYQRCFSLALCLVACGVYLFAQVQGVKPQTISSAPGEVIILLPLDSGEKLKLSSENIKL